MGGALVVAARAIAGLTALPEALLLLVGLSLLPIAAFMALVATRARPPAALVRPVIAGNALWVAGSVLLLLAPWIAPNALGVGFVLAQALAVAALAVLERAALHAVPDGWPSTVRGGSTAYEVGSQAASSRSRVKAPASVR
jgi:hypothetical protein